MYAKLWIHALIRLYSPLVSMPLSVKVAPPPPPCAVAATKFHAILQPASGSSDRPSGTDSRSRTRRAPVATSLRPHVSGSRSYLPAFASLAAQKASE
jgi:hypothetical protein